MVSPRIRGALWIACIILAAAVHAGQRAEAQNLAGYYATVDIGTTGGVSREELRRRALSWLERVFGAENTREGKPEEAVIPGVGFVASGALGSQFGRKEGSSTDQVEFEVRIFVINPEVTFEGFTKYTVALTNYRHIGQGHSLGLITKEQACPVEIEGLSKRRCKQEWLQTKAKLLAESKRLVDEVNAAMTAGAASWSGLLISEGLGQDQQVFFGKQ